MTPEQKIEAIREELSKIIERYKWAKQDFIDRDLASKGYSFQRTDNYMNVQKTWLDIEKILEILDD